MTTYIVTNKATGTEIYRYAADSPIAWSGMEFDTHNHIAESPEESVTDVIPTSYTWTKIEYLRRFTQEERIAIRTAAKTSAVLEDYMQLLELASEVKSDDPDIVAALTMLESVGLIGAGRAQEIINGN